MFTFSSVSNGRCFVFQSPISTISLSPHFVNNFGYFVFQHKCEQYWPELGSRQFGELRVETKETEHFANFTIRVFELQRVRTQLEKLRKGQQLLFALSFIHGNSV